MTFLIEPRARFLVAIGAEVEAHQASRAPGPWTCRSNLQESPSDPLPKLPLPAVDLASRPSWRSPSCWRTSTGSSAGTAGYRVRRQCQPGATGSKWRSEVTELHRRAESLLLARGVCEVIKVRPTVAQLSQKQASQAAMKPPVRAGTERQTPPARRRPAHNPAPCARKRCPVAPSS